ncbi:MAG: hypothetical protein ABSC87_06600 [Halobacteriota archaeon]
MNGIGKLPKELLTNKAVVERKKNVSGNKGGAIDEWQMINPTMSCNIQPQQMDLATSTKIYKIFTAAEEDQIRRPADYRGQRAKEGNLCSRRSRSCNASPPSRDNGSRDVKMNAKPAGSLITMINTKCLFRTTNGWN